MKNVYLIETLRETWNTMINFYLMETVIRHVYLIETLREVEHMKMFT